MKARNLFLFISKMLNKQIKKKFFSLGNMLLGTKFLQLLTMTIDIYSLQLLTMTHHLYFNYHMYNFVFPTTYWIKFITRKFQVPKTLEKIKEIIFNLTELAIQKLI